MRNPQKRQTLTRLAVAVGIAATGLGTASIGMAQSFPTKPVTILVPFDTGGFNDRIARAFKRGAQLTPQVRFILDDQYAHGLTLLCYRPGRTIRRYGQLRGQCGRPCPSISPIRRDET